MKKNKIVLLLTVVVILGLFSVPAYAQPLGAPPTNDNFSAATNIASLPFTTTQSTAEATLEASIYGSTEASYLTSCGESSGASVWYSFTPASDGTYVIDTFGSSFDTEVHIFEDDTFGIYDEACNQDFSGSVSQSKIVFDAVTTKTYKIAFTGKSAATGSLNIAMDSFSCPVTSLCVGLSDGLGTPIETSAELYDASYGYVDFGSYIGVGYNEFPNVASDTYNVALTGNNIFMIEEGVTGPGSTDLVTTGLVDVNISVQNSSASDINSAVYFTYQDVTFSVGNTTTGGPLSLQSSAITVGMAAIGTDNYHILSLGSQLLVDSTTYSLHAGTIPTDTLTLTLDGFATTDVTFDIPFSNDTASFTGVPSSSVISLAAPVADYGFDYTVEYDDSGDIWTFEFTDCCFETTTGGTNYPVSIGGTFAVTAQTDADSYYTGDSPVLDFIVKDEYDHLMTGLTFVSAPTVDFTVKDSTAAVISGTESGTGIDAQYDFTIPAMGNTGTWSGEVSFDFGGYQGPTSDTKNFTVSEAPPNNDDLDSPIVINPAGLPYTNTQTTQYATTEVGEPTYTCGTGSGASVWYSFSPTSTDIYEVNTKGSDFDTELHVFQKDEFDNLYLDECNQDLSASDVDSRLAFKGESGSTYMIGITGKSAATGSLTLNVSVFTCPATSICLDVTDGSGNVVDVNTNLYDNNFTYLDYGSYIGGSITEFTNISAGTYNLVATNATTFMIEESFSGPGTVSLATNALEEVSIGVNDETGTPITADVYFAYRDEAFLLGTTTPTAVTVNVTPTTLNISAVSTSGYYILGLADQLMSAGSSPYTLDASVLPTDTLSINYDNFTNGDVTFPVPFSTLDETFTGIPDGSTVYFAAPIEDYTFVHALEYTDGGTGDVWTFEFEDCCFETTTGGVDYPLTFGGTFVVEARTNYPVYYLGQSAVLRFFIYDGHDNRMTGLTFEDASVPAQDPTVNFLVKDSANQTISGTKTGVGLAAQYGFNIANSAKTGTWKGTVGFDFGGYQSLTSDDVNFTVKDTSTQGWSGSVVVESTKDIVAIGRPHFNKEVTAFNGFVNSSKTLYLPMLFNTAWEIYDSSVEILNVDSVNGGNIYFDFYDGQGNFTCSDSDWIGPSSVYSFYAVDFACLAEGWVGSAVVTGEVDIVAVARPEAWPEYMTYNSFSSGELTQYVPMLFKIFGVINLRSTSKTWMTPIRPISRLNSMIRMGTYLVQ